MPAVLISIAADDHKPSNLKQRESIILHFHTAKVRCGSRWAHVKVLAGCVLSWRPQEKTFACVFQPLRADHMPWLFLHFPSQQRCVSDPPSTVAFHPTPPHPRLLPLLHLLALLRTLVIELTWIIQCNLPILGQPIIQLYFSCNIHFSLRCKATCSQVPEIRIWASLGTVILLTIPVLGEPGVHWGRQRSVWKLL